MAQRSADERLPLVTLAARGAVVERLVDCRELARFGRLCKPDGSVRARLTFGPDDDGGIRIEGTLSVPVLLDCQRCLEAVPVDLGTDFAVVAVTSEADAARLGTGGDVQELGTCEPTLAELIEDELILALPQRPCARRDCEKAPPLAYPPETERGDNPFGALAALKKGD
ncbi:MAG: YceD family protein [Gammaproteobacteria bacterium]|nr:YceD family protein [Gammaproteobacteria bacterium]